MWRARGGRLAVIVGGLVWLAALLGPPSAAHKGHGKASPSPSPSASAAAAASSLPMPGTAAPLKAPATAPAASPSPVSAWTRMPWSDVLYGHLHNKIVHFPLALGLAAAVFFIVSRWWPQYTPAGRALVLAAAVLAVAAYFSGQAQHEAFEDGPLEEVMELHRTMGITSGVALWLGVALGAWPRGRRWLWLFACLLMVVLAVTGTLGGILSHSEL